MAPFTRQDTTTEPIEEAEDLPQKRGVECMNNNYDAKLWGLVEKRKLGDLSQFHQQGFFDEVPLYTRKSDVDFLPRDQSANEILLTFALKFLKSVIAYEEHPRGYFAAITLWDYSDGPSKGPLVPNLFAWCRPVQELERKLALGEVKTPFGKRIRKLVPKLGLSDRFSVREDTGTEPGSTRVFVAPMIKPYQGFLTLGRFRSPALNSK